MTDHYTTATESALAWCNHCQRRTRHPVSAHKLGRCAEHEAPLLTHKQQKKLDQQKREAQQPRLFQ